MARLPQVTRTIQTTNATVLCLDVETAEPINMTVTLPRTYKDEKSMFKAVVESMGDGNVKPVHIVNYETKEVRYGMSEKKFIENADVIPPLH